MKKRMMTGTGICAGLSLALTTAASAYVLIDVDTDRFTGWIGPDHPVEWRLNTDLNDNTIANEFEILRGSFDAWTVIPSIDITFSEGANTTFCGLSQNMVNHVSMEDCFSQCTGSCLGVTSTVLYAVGDGFWNTNTVSDSLYLARQESDITFSATRNWDDYRDWGSCAGAFDLWGVATHEVGHFIGLGHSQFGQATMFASVAPCDPSKASLYIDDERGARVIYRDGTKVAATTMTAGASSLTVTNKGNTAYTGSGGRIGESFRWDPLGAAEHIFEASFAVQAGNGAVSDNYRVENAGLPGGDADFQQSSDLVIDGTPDYVAQEATATFDDSRAESPWGFDITANYYADDAVANEDFVITEYVITNNSGQTRNNVRGGVIADVDFNNLFSTNSVNYDAANHLAYVSGTNTSSFMGIAILNAEGGVAMRGLNNATDDATDANKQAWFNGGFSSTSAGPADIALLIATGDWTLANGESACAAFAYIGGSSLADLQANAQQAQDLYQNVIKQDPANAPDLAGHAVMPLALEQNSPNPFRGKTRLAYTLLEEGPVSLDIIDASGRVVTHLVQESQGKGQYSLVWDGTDTDGNTMPSGVYFSRLRQEGRNDIKKMLLID